MKRVKNSIWKDCFGVSHILDDEIDKWSEYIGNMVYYDTDVCGTLTGIFYDDEDIYYGICRIDGKQEYCSCVGELALI
jgi:hypothetical protein